MISGGPAAMQLGRVRASLLDFYITESDELIVEAVSGSSLRDEHVEILIDWARTVGYERIWLPDRVVDIEAEPAIVGVAKVNCRTCGARWEDSSTDFWLKVRDNGFFPASCPACGDSLPEMTVEAEQADVETDVEADVAEQERLAS
jgi:hypothetical protein